MLLWNIIYYKIELTKYYFNYLINKCKLLLILITNILYLNGFLIKRFLCFFKLTINKYTIMYKKKKYFYKYIINCYNYYLMLLRKNNVW